MTFSLKKAFCKNNIISVLEYVLMAFVIIYSSLWALFTSANNNTFLRLAVPVLLILIFLRAKILRNSRLIRLLFLSIALGVYIVFSRFNFTRYLLYYFLPIVLLTVYVGLVDEQSDIRSLFCKLSNIVCFLSVVSLVLFLFGTLLKLIPSMPVAYSWAGTRQTTNTYLHFLYESQDIVFLGHPFVRNCGIFAEAPGFAVFLVISTAVEVFLKEKLSIPRCCVLFITVVTTFSAKAIILAIISFALKYLITSSGSFTAKRFKLFFTPIVLAVGAVIVAVVFFDKAQSYSYLMRVDDLQASMRTFADNPIFGAGYVNDGAITDNFRLLTRPNNGLSMGVVVLLAQGGLWLTLLNIVPAVTMITRLNRDQKLRWACFLVVFWGLLFITNMPYGFITMFVLATTVEGYRNYAKQY